MTSQDQVKRLLNAADENFMTELNVRMCLTGLKIKNCEGTDRIPLRILNDVAKIMFQPMKKLLNLIYTMKLIPNQWCMAKIIPTHKNGLKNIITLNCIKIQRSNTITK